jgi:rRNA maturation endonuclease Nob1
MIKSLKLSKIDQPKNYGERESYIDKDGYLYALSIGNLKVINRRNSLPARFFRNNPYTYENINKFIGLNCSNVTIISENATDAKDVLQFACSEHGIFNKCWNEIKNGQYCPICGDIKGNNARRNKFEDVFVAFELRNYKLISTEYIDNESHLSYICLNHESQGLQYITWGNFITKNGCKFCGRENMIRLQSKTHDQFVSELYAIQGNKYQVKSEYINSKVKVSIHCIDCNSTFPAKPHHLINGHMGCNCKPVSFGEDAIRFILGSNEIPFKQQHRFTNCKNKKPLPFDFAVFSDEEKTKILYLIEFNGKQHYQVTGWSSNEDKNKEYFIKQQENDNIKRQYCIDNNIKLIEIPYWEMKNIESILLST